MAMCPLYIYPSETTHYQTGALSFDEIKREPNINPAFVKVLLGRIGKTPTPKKSSVTFTRFFTRRGIAKNMPSSCGWIFRACHCRKIKVLLSAIAK
jgi:hypothetical protein